ncbi:g8489 [Coccomyxa viridis]|uniref:G8489 protein n=1 Tax=Coccomyxa viridis TaxID=1274662 RepID=A0ABP1G0M6_9CHLO
MRSLQIPRKGCPIRQSHAWVPRAQGCSRLKVSCAAQLEKYKPPSSAVGATELEYLESHTTVVPDTLLLQNIEEIEAPKAATVSSAVLAGILRTPGALQEYKFAIENAINYDKCHSKKGEDRLACLLDKATVNIGTLFSKQVEGRVSTEVDPRLAYDTDALVKRAQNLLVQYKEMDIPQERVLLRIPGTWEGIQAAKQLEDQGVATHIILVYSLVQAIAAAQAGVSVIQPNIGRLDDWYAKHPGVIRDPKGPREDTGFMSAVNPGVRMAERIYNFCKKYHAKTQVMVSGIRKPADALALCGVDYLVVGPKVLATLKDSQTLQGYNDGLTSLPQEDEYAEPRLSPELAAKEEFEAFEREEVTKQIFEEGLGLAGVALLKQGVQGLVDDIDRMEPFFTNLSIGQE